MTIKINLLCYFGFLLFCSAQLSVAQQTGSSIRAVSDSYRPSDFANDDRVEKIREMAPDIQKLMEEHAVAMNIPGIAYGIVVDDKLVLAAAKGLSNLEKEFPATIQTGFRIASMTKSFTAMAIMKLRDEGKLSLDDPVSDYIPGMAGLKYLTGDSPVIAIRNLLTMTAGFPEDNPWGDRQLDEPDQMLMELITEGISFSNPPAYEYEYSNTGYALLGKIISVAAGQPYQEYILESILKPLGMEQTYWEYDSVPEDHLAIGYRWEDGQWKLEPMLHDGSFGAMGGLITTIEDFSKYVGFHLAAWPPRSEPDEGPVKRSTLREMHTPTFARLNTGATDLNGDPCAIISGYGYGLGITKDCHGRKWISHGGALPGFGSNYIFYPDYGVGIMAFGNLTYTGPLPAKEIEKLLFESADLQPRQLPVSAILLERQEQVVRLIQYWEPALEAEILAENFYPDKSRKHRMSEVRELLDKAGPFQSMGKMEPQNQLRGSFKLNTENGIVTVFFTLTPEKNPKVQFLNLSFQTNESRQDQ